MCVGHERKQKSHESNKALPPSSSVTIDSIAEILDLSRGNFSEPPAVGFKTRLELKVLDLQSGFIDGLVDMKKRLLPEIHAQRLPKGPAFGAEEEHDDGSAGRA